MSPISASGHRRVPHFADSQASRRHGDIVAERGQRTVPAELLVEVPRGLAGCRSFHFNHGLPQVNRLAVGSWCVKHQQKVHSGVEVPKRRLNPAMATAGLSEPVVHRQQFYIASGLSIGDDVLHCECEVDLVADFDTIRQRRGALHLPEDYLVHEHIINRTTKDDVTAHRRGWLAPSTVPNQHIAVFVSESTRVVLATQHLNCFATNGQLAHQALVMIP